MQFTLLLDAITKLRGHHPLRLVLCSLKYCSCCPVRNLIIYPFSFTLLVKYAVYVTLVVYIVSPTQSHPLLSPFRLFLSHSFDLRLRYGDIILYCFMLKTNSNQLLMCFLFYDG